MKRFSTTLLFSAFALSVLYAQAPKKLSYQAVVRNSENEPVANQQVGMRISLLQGSATGNAVYSETVTPVTNTSGLVSIEIGVVNPDGFSTIEWGAGPYFIQTETDPTGGTNYTLTATSQLLSVPYALYAETSGSSLPGPPGADGTSAYELAVENGFSGTEAEWLASLEGADGATGPAGSDGADGDSAYDLAVASGFSGTEAEWLAGLEGADGATGPAGSDGTNGASAYDLAVTNGFTGTEAEWLTSLEGADGSTGPAGSDGADGASAYALAVASGFSGTEAEWLTSLEGADGAAGAPGGDGADGKTILNGTTDPAAGTGVDGDFYLNTASSTLFGPKTGGSWGSGTSLVGATGPAGPSAPVGIVNVQTDATSRTFDPNWGLGPTFSTISGFSAGSKIKLTYHVPCRNDDAQNHGGGYIEPQISFDGGTTWNSLGSSGWDGGVMHSGARSIGSYFNSILIDPAQSSTFSVTVRFYYKSNLSSLIVNGDHDINAISGTATLMPGVNGQQHYTKVIVEEIPN